MNTRVALRIVVIVLCAFGRPAPLVAQAPSTGTLAGTVVTREGGRPVPEAVISIEGTGVTAVTNAIGRFRLDGVPTGEVVILAEAPGYLNLRVPNVQVQRDSSQPLTIELEVTPNFMERVQVTATKAPLSIGDVAAQTDIIGRDLIERRGDQSLTQAIAHVPGAVVSTQLGLFESVTLRGLPRGDPEFTNTLLLIDGVPQTLSNNGARVVALPINDVNSVEIVRGPNSALYGRTAIGGSVNVRTADPTPQPQFGVEFTGGQFDTLKGLASVSGPVQNWGGYYASIGKQRDHGYFENRTTSNFTTGNTAFFGKLTFAPDRQSSGSVSVNRVVSENSTPTNEPVIDGQLLHKLEPRFDRLTNFNIPGPNYRQEESRFTVNYTRDLSTRLKAVGVFGYRAVQHKFIDDGDFIGTPSDLASHTVTMYPFSQQMDEDIFYQEARLDWTPTLRGTTTRLTLGGSYEHNAGALASDFIFTDEDLGGWTIDYLNPVIPPRSEWQHDASSRTYHLGITALFAQYVVEPTSRVVLTAAGRYDRLALDNTRGTGARIEDTFDAFSPKLSATFKALTGNGSGAPSVSLYGAYSHAFLPPRRPSSLVPADVPLNLRPEEIDNYEGGVKGSVFGGRLNLEGTYFWMKEDGVVLSTRQGPFFLPTNAGQQRYKGVETGASYSLSPKASVYFNAALYRNRFGAFVIQSEDGDEELTGNRLPISPDHVFNWGASFAPVASVDGTISIKQVGGVQTNRENTFELDPYTTVDAAVSWRRGPLRLTLSAHNLTNEAYYWNGDGETADPGRPRQVLLTTSVTFR